MNFEWYEHQADSLVLLSASFGVGKANYLWLRLDDAIEPRSYVVPWNMKLAEKLEDAVEEAVRPNSTAPLKKPSYRRGFKE